MIRWKPILSEMRKVRWTVEEATRIPLICMVPKMPPTQFIFLNYTKSKWYFCRNIHIKKTSKSIYPKAKPGSVCTTPVDSCVTTEVTWIKTCELCSTAAGFIYLFFSFTVSKQIERFEIRRYHFQHSEINQVPGGVSRFFCFFSMRLTRQESVVLFRTHTC